MTKPTAIERAVLLAGSQAALAAIAGVSQPTVNNWIRSGRVSAEKVLPIYKKLGIHPFDLRPDIYPRKLVSIK